jgi:hypothetical protein
MITQSELLQGADALLGGKQDILKAVWSFHVLCPFIFL